MIPVVSQPQPADFSRLVREPGNQFLAQVPNPTSREWQNHAYWRKVLPHMRKAYGEICAYCAHWIPPSTGNHSVDHFVPKSQNPRLAYEWSNYRYVSARFNSRKGLHVILDPFQLAPDWFVLDFASFLIKPHPALSISQKGLVNQTISCLKLNIDEDLVLERQNWFECYYRGEISLAHLRRRAPFLAYELQRQGKLKIV